MQKSAKRGTSGTLLVHGLYFKGHSAVVDGVVHVTVQRRQVYVTRVLQFLAATALLCVSNAMFSPLPRVQCFLGFLLHLASLVGLLCANYVTDRFGKGTTPAR